VGAFDVFVNVAGGVKIEEPAVDLGTMAAIASSFKDVPADNKSILIGEVGLGGEVRAVSQMERRIKEAEKLGFENCIIPQGNLKALNQRFDIKITGVRGIKETFDLILT